MIQLTNIYKTAKAGNRDNQSTLHIDQRDPKFFFTLTAEKPVTFKAELKLNGKTEYHLFDLHERQMSRGIDYAFPLGKMPSGEHNVVFRILVNGAIHAERNLKLIG